MATRIIRPVERMSIQSSDNNNPSIVTLARRINVAPFKEVTAYVRMHPGSVVAPTPNTGLFLINADGFTDEDPAAVNSASVPAFQTLLNGSGTSITGLAAGQMLVVAVPANFGSMLSLQWQVKTSSSAQLNHIISIDLICKEF